MGCDIHAFVEFGDRGGMECFGAVNILRDYALFAVLAGVRNYGRIEPVHAPRGLPGNMADEVGWEYRAWEADAHSASWLTVEELEQAQGQYTGMGLPNRTWVQGRHRVLDAIIAAMRVLGDTARLTFWFDN